MKIVQLVVMPVRISLAQHVLITIIYKAPHAPNAFKDAKCVMQLTAAILALMAMSIIQP